jgi:hypothetical protein
MPDALLVLMVISILRVSRGDESESESESE